MRRVAGLVGAALLFAGPALAADLAVKAPPPPPYFLWTGFYVGAHAGGGWSNVDWFFPDFGTSTSHKASGFIGGGQFGYNYQVSSWVFGVQGDLSGVDLNGESVCPNTADRCRTEGKWLASATARVGYAFDHALLYGKGGAAWIRDDELVLHNGVTTEVNAGGGDGFGWTAGVGLEYAFWQHWSAFVEYDHYHFTTGNFATVNPNTNAFVERLNVNQRLDEVKVGVNYKF